MTLRVSYTGHSRGWRGALREGSSVVWECPHYHRNRDESSRTNGQSARDCARTMYRAVTDPALFERAARPVSGFGSLIATSFDADLRQSREYISLAKAFLSSGDEL